MPHVPFSGDLGGEASELRALSFDHVPAMSVSGFATAACAGDCGVEWHGNGRIAGHSALYGLSTPRLLQLEAIVDEILIASLKASHTTGSRDSKEQK